MCDENVQPAGKKCHNLQNQRVSQEKCLQEE